jgi:hypothetical protein
MLPGVARPLKAVVKPLDRCLSKKLLGLTIRAVASVREVIRSLNVLILVSAERRRASTRRRHVSLMDS